VLKELIAGTGQESKIKGGDWGRTKCSWQKAVKTEKLSRK
jgi:hypothetical protein